MRERWWVDKLVPTGREGQRSRRQKDEWRTALFSLGDGTLKLKDASSATLLWMLFMRISGLIVLGALLGALTGIIK